MGRLLQVWAYTKTNAALLGIALGIILFCSGASYYKGNKDANTRCEAEKAKGFQKVNEELLRIREADEAQAKEWAKQNKLIADTLEMRVTDTYKIVEKIIEKPVPVIGDCDIGYELVELLNDAAAPDAD